MKRWRIGLVDRRQAAALFALRVAAYRAAPEFAWNDEAALAWSGADDAGAVLGLWDDEGRLLSTTRASVFNERDAAEAFLEYSLQGVAVPMPALVLSRAATDPAQACHGLFALLRHAYLQALAATPLRSVVAIVYEGGPRLRSMREAGYAFHEPRAGWDSEAVARTQPLLAVLPHTRFAAAAAGVATALGERLECVDSDTASIAAALTAQCAVPA